MSARPNNPAYQKLPGRGSSALKACRLWQGPDHLLQVESSFVGERYKRFYFADLQAFVLRKTWWPYLLSATIWVVVIAIFAAASVPLQSGLAFWVTATLTVLSVVGLIIHLSLGGTCACHVRTAVQFEELPSLRRLRNARRVIAHLRPLIEEAQTLPRETIAVES